MPAESTSSSYTAAYQGALAALNSAQRRAVETIDGPVMVVAGPGTGKTQILTLRIVHILYETDAAPEHILALTFTEAGAHAMRDRLRQYLGTDAYRVPIFTFHGFAADLIQRYPDAFPRIVGGTALGELEQVTYIESIIQSGPYTLLRPVGNPQHHVRSVLQQITTMKREYITPERLHEIIRTQLDELSGMEQYHETGAHAGKVRGAYHALETSIKKNQELVSIYERYEALLRESVRYDFEDMILEAVHALKTHEPLLRELQETYQYVLADEHQDVNESQNQILERLVSYHDRPNIFVVGDEKQAIYRFQGASLANFLYFGDRFSDTTTIDLTENYRSGQTILDAAAAVIATDDPVLAPLRVPLTAAAVPSSQVSVHAFRHEVAEDAWVVEQVAEAIAAGTSPEEIAVIVRTNRAVEHIAHLLRARSIAVNASADGDITTHPITRYVRALVRAVRRPEDESALATVVHMPFWGLSIADVQRILQARSRRQPLSTVLSDSALLKAASVEQVAAATSIIAVLTTLRDRMVTEPAHRVLELALHESGLLRHVHEHDPLEGGRVIRRLYDTVIQHMQSGDITTFPDIDRVLEQYESYGLSLVAPYLPSGDQAVQVLTAHKAKGLEFSVVFVPHLVDSTWGGATKRGQFAVPLSATSGTGGAEDDDRRLLYVAMTRAKTRLALSYASENAEGKQRSPSRFLVSLGANANVAWPDMASATIDPAATIPHLAVAPSAALFDLPMIRAVLAERGLSATSFNNYRSSPWNYLYRNILRWPELPTLSLQYGTVIHACLEQSVRTYTEHGSLPTVSDLAHKLSAELNHLPLSEAEYAQLHEKGLTELAVYREHLAATVADASTSSVEANLRVVLPTDIPELPELPLTGKLDRIDRGADGTIQRVVDYKTGTPKSRNAIEGKTRNADDSYKQQLLFYAVLLSLRGAHHDGIAYTLSFVQPTKSGVVKEEAFYITEDEVAAAKGAIKEVAREIVTGSFLATPCDPDTSDYCDLVAVLLDRSTS